jgi:hypothetical protein
VQELYLAIFLSPFKKTSGNYFQLARNPFLPRPFQVIISLFSNTRRYLVRLTDYASIFCSWLDSASGPRLPHCWGFELTLRRTTRGRTPPDERLACCWNLYLTTLNTLKRQASMPPAGFEPAFPAIKRHQIHVLDRAATGIGMSVCRSIK